MCSESHLLGAYVVIDGMGLPNSLYTLLKAQAQETHKTQWVGVVNKRPAELQIASGDSEELRIAKNNTMRGRERTGTGSAFILGLTRGELREQFGSQLAMILWITPEGNLSRIIV